MSFRDLEQRWLERAEYEYAQKRRSRFLAILFIISVIAALVLSIWLAIALGAFKSDILRARPAGEITVSFGFNRQPATRNFAMDVKQVPTTTNTDKTVKNANANSGQTSTDIITVRLASDLRRADKAGEFPAEQITVGISRLTSTRVNLAVTGNPWTPEKVPPGLYTGNLELRGAGVSQSVPITIWLRSRENKWAALAFALLFLGSMLGLLVKWITERLTTQAVYFRRLAALKEAVGYREESATLPISARLRLQRLEDQISREDYAAAQESFQYLEQYTEQLALLASQFQILLNQLASQSSMLDEAGSDQVSNRNKLFLQAVIDSEYREVQDLLTQPWEKDEDYKKLRDQVWRLRLTCGEIRNAMVDFMRSPSDRLLRESLSKFQASDFTGGLGRYLAWQETPESKSQRRAERSDDLVTESPFVVAQPLRRRGFLPPRGPSTHLAPASSVSQGPQRTKFLFRQARSLAGVASVIVVSLVGLKLQYLDDQQFDGALTSWLGLALWGAVVELSGVSVLDVVGRLGTSAAGTTTAARG